MSKAVVRLVKEEEGQALTEYGLAIGIIAIGAIVAVIALKDKIIALFTSITSNVAANTPS